jgi:hypothetical protein
MKVMSPRGPGSGDAGGTGAPELDERGQAGHQQQPDGEQNQGQHGHRRHL